MPLAGTLGKVRVDTTGIVTLRLASDKLNVPSVIGRSVVVSSLETKEWYVAAL